ncbi:hypothetical protein HYV86_07915 [Candidatus Woesearchaeota archaeon]|nr:hypothetical protein [Candidatus Woesearchaeota archaeon]
MADVSNRTVVALLAVALVVTVAGTLVSVSKLSTLGGQYSFLTGAATSGTGTTSLTSDYEVAISIDDNAVSFGTGHVEIGYTNASVHSSGVFNDTAWYNTTGLYPVNTTHAPNVVAANTSAVTNVTTGDWMVVSNSGNVDFNLTVFSYTATSGEFWLCGSDGGCASTAVAQLLVMAAANESNACDEANIPPGEFHNNQTNSTWQNLLTVGGRNNITLCQDLDYGDTGDAMNIYFQAYVPSDATNGAHSVTLTFEATSRNSQD